MEETEHLSCEVIEKNKKNAEITPKLTFRDSLPQITASCVINLIVIQAGINMAFSSILIPQLSLPESDIQIDLDSSSTVASIVTLSIAFGALACGPLMDKYGRQLVLFKHTHTHIHTYRCSHTNLNIWLSLQAAIGNNLCAICIRMAADCPLEKSLYDLCGTSVVRLLWRYLLCARLCL